MAFETKEEVLEKVKAMARPACPHCNAPMSIWEVPSINVGDGLGWGTPYLFMCFKDFKLGNLVHHIKLSNVIFDSQT